MRGLHPGFVALLCLVLARFVVLAAEHAYAAATAQAFLPAGMWVVAALALTGVIGWLLRPLLLTRARAPSPGRAGSP